MLNVIRGTDKNDIKNIGDGNSFVELFRGNDLIVSGIGDTYYRHYGIDDGHDILEDNGGDNDQIQFINIKNTELRLQRLGNDLIFWTIKDGGKELRYNLVTVKNHFSDVGENKIEYLILDNKKYAIKDLTRNLVGRKSLSVDLLSSEVPLPKSRASRLSFSLALDDVTNPITHLYHSERTSHCGLSDELDVLGQRYKFAIRKSQIWLFGLKTICGYRLTGSWYFSLIAI